MGGALRRARSVQVAGLRPSTIAETTNSSMPVPGAQVLMSSRLSAFGVTRISTKPASASQVSVSATVAAPAIQPQSSAGSFFNRAGNGALDRLREAGEFVPPRLPTLERALEAVLELRRGRAFADTWDLEQFSACAACLEQRRQRLHQMNRQQSIPPKLGCPVCGET